MKGKTIVRTTETDILLGEEQIFIPLPVMEALWPIMNKFQFISLMHINKYTKEAERTVFPIQKKWWREHS